MSMETQAQFFSEMEGRASDFMSGMLRMQKQIMLLVATSGIGALLLIITAVAVLKRRNWGRILFVSSGAVLVAFALFLLFYYGRNYQSQISEMLARVSTDGGGIDRQIERVAGFQLLAYGIFYLIALWALVRVLIKMGSKRMKAYFY